LAGTATQLGRIKVNWNFSSELSEVANLLKNCPIITWQGVSEHILINPFPNGNE